MRQLPAAVEIRPAVLADADHIAANLREADRAECLAAGATDLVAEIRDGIVHSDLCWTATLDGLPAAIFGVRPWGDAGVPWMLGTDAVTLHQRAFIQHSPTYIARMVEAYPRMLNSVHTQNKQAIRWLRRVGFQVHQAQAHPQTGELFHTFTMGY